MKKEQLISVLNDIDHKLPAFVKLVQIAEAKPYQFDKVELHVHETIVRFRAEYKTEPRLMHLPSFTSLNQEKEPVLVIAKQISKNVREELRKYNINYLDAAGNIYLDQKPVLIYIDGQKNEVKPEVKSRAFTKTGLKVIFAFLQYPELINLPYRQIAVQTGAALDTVHHIINGLKEMGYLIAADSRKLKLTNSHSLLLRWAQDYEMKLKPALLLGRFRFAKAENFANWQQLDIGAPLNQWGGEPAGDLLTNFLRPAVLTIYTEQNKMEVMKELKLIPDANGPVELYHKFWKDTNTENSFVPEILVYTDLLNHGDPRNAEIAQRIYEKYLQDRFSKN